MTYKCSTCGAENLFVNQCGCDQNNLPTQVPQDTPIQDEPCQSPCCNRVSHKVLVGGVLVRWQCPCGKLFKGKALGAKTRRSYGKE